MITQKKQKKSLKTWLSNKFTVDRATLEQYRFFRFFAPYLNASPGYWRFSRRSTAWGASLGLFGAFMLVPFQTMIVLIMALIVRANLPLSLGLIWINNPFTIAPLYYLCYRVGAWILQTPAQTVSTITYQSLTHAFEQIWPPFLLGTLVCGVIAGCITYCVVWFSWWWFSKKG